MVNVDKVKAAMERARTAQERLYLDTCTVTEFQDSTDSTTGLSEWEEVVTLKDQPCKLSFETLKEATTTGSGVAVSQIVKLFISPDVEIKPGSKISVTRDDLTTDYTYSGVPHIDSVHQELVLTLFKGWA